MEIPESLEQKLALFKASGGLNLKDDELFRPTSWYAVLEGLGVRPDHYNPTLNTWDSDKLKSILTQGKDGLINISLQQPSHDEFINDYCKAKE
jgi:tryptophan halogenase